ncbi:hypothetical protein N8I77_012407 [Diaporthe amygdali]|uniref:Uncharacterized protein n=1 Tax=Phomopsis amygdali TaxID=1214568 RepID=A0AAD9VXG7_PHOAM|nr:hypothetical protein N8I77_012407 [Diaporthe amygdali]
MLDTSQRDRRPKQGALLGACEADCAGRGAGGREQPVDVALAAAQVAWVVLDDGAVEGHDWGGLVIDGPDAEAWNSASASFLNCHRAKSDEATMAAERRDMYDARARMKVMSAVRLESGLWVRGVEGLVPPRHRQNPLAEHAQLRVDDDVAGLVEPEVWPAAKFVSPDSGYGEMDGDVYAGA